MPSSGLSVAPPPLLRTGAAPLAPNGAFTMVVPNDGSDMTSLVAGSVVSVVRLGPATDAPELFWGVIAGSVDAGWIAVVGVTDDRTPVPLPVVELPGVLKSFTIGRPVVGSIAGMSAPGTTLRTSAAGAPVVVVVVVAVPVPAAAPGTAPCAQTGE